VEPSYKIIDNIVCYSPEAALQNEDFDASIFPVYDKLIRKNFWYRSRNDIIQWLLKKFASGNSLSMLEIGCGTGYVLSGLKKNNVLKLTGSEIYLEGLKYAKENNPGVDFFQVDICKVSFENKYDVIGCFDVLEHIERDEEALKNIYASLKPGGLLLISVPAYMFLWSFMDEINKHKRRYSKKELLTKIKAAGFSVQYCSFFVFTLFPFLLLNRILNRKKDHKPVEQLTFDEMAGYLNLDINPVVNGVFRLLMKIDETLMKIGFRLPFGSSIIISARK